MIEGFTNRFQALAGTRMRGNDNWILVLVGQGSQRFEQITKVVRRIDVFFTVSADDEELVLLQAFSRQHVGGEDLRHVVVEHLLHVRTGLDDGFRTNPFSDQVSPGMLCQDHVDIAQVIEHLAIQFFRDALIKAAVAGFHVEHRNLAALGGNDG
ncbi:hypothetical protein D3C87_1376290 [compost metagenome]